MLQMDLRLTFNTAVENYDRFRPTYTEELYEDVIRYAGLDGEKDALEIGIGAGQATPPFLKASRRVTAIEIGDELARFTKEKFAACENLKVVHRDSESATLEADAYDLVYSVTNPSKTENPKAVCKTSQIVEKAIEDRETKSRLQDVVSPGFVGTLRTFV